MFLPITKAGATQVYVGVKIASAVAPGYDANSDGVYGSTEMDNNWCLPVDSQMAILNSTACDYLSNNYSAADISNYYCSSSFIPDVSTGVKYVTTTSPTCAGNTIWSGLLNLTTATSYKIYLYTPNFCSGYYDGYCYAKWTAGKNCTETCAHYGMTTVYANPDCLAYSGTYNYSTGEYDCSGEAKLKGSACASCTSGSYSYYSTSTNACFYSSSYGACTWLDSNYVRVCNCNFNGTATGFNFNFTSSF